MENKNKNKVVDQTTNSENQELNLEAEVGNVEQGFMIEENDEIVKTESIKSNNLSSLENGIYIKLKDSDKAPVKITERMARYYETDPKWEVIRPKKNNNGIWKPFN